MYRSLRYSIEIELCFGHDFIYFYFMFPFMQITLEPRAVKIYVNKFI